MLVSSLLFFFFFVAVNSGNVSTLRNINNELVSDDHPQFEETINGGVRIMSHGTAQLVLTNGRLDFEVDLVGCRGYVLVCYGSSSTQTYEDVSKLCEPQSNFCGFLLNADDNKVQVATRPIPRSFFKPPCSSTIQMEFPKTFYCGNEDMGCEPAVDKENRITIEVRRVSAKCPVTILNAKVYVPPSSTSTSSSTSKAVTIITTEATGESSTWWIWAIVSFFVIIIVIGIVIFVYRKRSLKKKREELNNLPLTGITIGDEVKQHQEENAKVQPEKKEAVKVEEPKKLNVPKAKTPKKKKEAPPPPKIDQPKQPESKSKLEQPKQPEAKPKKEQPKQPKSLPKKEQPTIATEESEQPPQLLPATPVFESKEPIVVEPLTLKNIKKQSRPWALQMGSAKSRSSGSRFRGRYRDSVESQRSFNMKQSFGSHYDSMKRNGLLGENAKEMIEKMSKCYKPDPKKNILSVEVSLLYNFIGDVFVTINGLVKKSIDELKIHGLKLDKNGDITHITSNVQKFLQHHDTPEYIKFTCFALEYGHLVPGDEEHLPKYSMALLLVVAFSLNQPDESRRRALAIMRRELPFWRRESSVKERHAFGYPANSIEAAYQIEPKCFDDTKLVQTNSSPNASEEKRSKSNSKKEAKETPMQSKEVGIEKPKSKSKSNKKTKKKKQH